jgi:putative aldouronate transport system permease protein
MIVAVRKYGAIYLFVGVGLVYFFLFRLVPLGYNYIAFTDFNPIKGIFSSPFVGLKHFRRLVLYDDLNMLIGNTFSIGVMRILLGFWIPILFTLLLHDFRNPWVKKSLQTVIYFPHFISWVVVAGLTYKLLSPSSGIVNLLIIKLGGEPIPFVNRPEWFRWILVFQGIWKESGFGTIIYLAALAGVSPDLYEAAKMDGANKWQTMRHINIPALSGTIAIMLLLAVGRMINENFAQIFIMLNPMVYKVGEVFETYVYRVGILEGQISYTTAVSLFKSLVAAIMVLGSNFVVKKMGHRGMF